MKTAPLRFPSPEQRCFSIFRIFRNFMRHRRTSRDTFPFHLPDGQTSFFYAPGYEGVLGAEDGSSCFACILNVIVNGSLALKPQMFSVDSSSR